MSLSTYEWRWCPECRSWLSGEAISEHNRQGRWNDHCPGTPIDLVAERKRLLAERKRLISMVVELEAGVRLSGPEWQPLADLISKWLMQATKVGAPRGKVVEA